MSVSAGCVPYARVLGCSHLNSIYHQMVKKMEYAPYDKVAINKSACIALRNLKPHRRVIKFFMSHFEGTLYQSDSLLRVFNESVLLWFAES